MNLKTFEGKTTAEALAKVKRHFGREAVILHTRSVTRGQFLGYGGEQVIEITAAKDGISLPVKRGGASVPARPKARQMVDAATKEMREATRSAPSVDAGVVALADEIDSLKSTMAELVAETRRARDPSLPVSLQELYQQLIKAEVAEEIAGDLVRKVRSELAEPALSDRSAVRVKLASFIESMLPVAGPVRLVSTSTPTVIALVGPTGVGKTTTVAKLAANYRLRHNREVGLITIDTFRIAAVDQLETYAKIIDVPLKVVVTADEMREALHAMRKCDIILIDTAGRSQNDHAKLAELKTLLDEAKPHEIHLVLSSTCHTAVLRQTIRRFTALGANRVIVSKLDEAVGFGVILNCLKDAEARLSYVTTGQNVPQDIEVGRGANLAKLIISGHASARSDEASRRPAPSR